MFNISQERPLESDWDATSGKLIDFVAAQRSQGIVRVHSNSMVLEKAYLFSFDESLLREPFYIGAMHHKASVRGPHKICQKFLPKTGPPMIVIGHTVEAFDAHFVNLTVFLYRKLTRCRAEPTNSGGVFASFLFFSLPLFSSRCLVLDFSIRC